LEKIISAMSFPSHHTSINARLQNDAPRGENRFITGTDGAWVR
jgi:hypothetical protein